MPDYEQRGRPPALRPNEPAPVDPEQVRQFQQFQQFQELIRQHGGVPPGAGPPPSKPLWKRVLTSKAVRKLALLLVVALGLLFAFDYYFGNKNDDLPASETGGGTNQTNKISARTPKEAVRLVYAHIAQFDKANNADEARREAAFVCGQFGSGKEQDFAKHFGAATCELAVAKLNGEIDKPPNTNWRNAYGDPFIGARDPVLSQTETEAVVTSCTIQVRPRLGEFTLEQVRDQNGKLNGTWVIIGHRLETC
ncbi:MAG TPA: hypothetical protein VFV67_02880 [Actinophytocola sp.]|uniref:hypothetical protein n=1 Tax=Actinophytocola sp. TaxID=1872138 RepID=UPI002DBC9111|nr:hypothetical protein [Actinophytocola sp.]HEU5469571.1 hypothetical protein [Actinophytocola sp.]